MLFPKNRKYKKSMKRRNNKLLNKGTKSLFCQFSITSISFGRINSKQLESARIVIKRLIKGKGKFFLRIFPDKPLTKKPIEVRMGNGKGDVYEYVSNIFPGKILFELNCINYNLIKKAFYVATSKLPIKTILVKND
ncbi:50S ribosomal protein L16 [Candidatus Vidania fulgoroideorum]